MAQAHDRDFTFQEESRHGGHDCCLDHIPASFWASFEKKPFRKRHPLMFWLLVVALLLVVGGMGAAAAGDEPREDCLALVKVHGTISDIGKTLVWIEELGHKDNVRGVLVRVDSPGGGAAASQELYGALARLAQTRPVAVSMGASAASGGLMVSMAGHRVFASGSTVTGSIGVRMDIPLVRELVERLGVGQQTLTTAPYKDAGSMLRPLSDAERAYFEGVIRDMHEQFVDIVARGRGMEREKAAALADGRIMTGREALAAGLVDELGGYDAAKAWLCGQTGVPEDRKLFHMEDDDHVQRFIRKYMTTLVDVLQDARFEGPAFLYR